MNGHGGSRPSFSEPSDFLRIGYRFIRRNLINAKRRWNARDLVGAIPVLVVLWIWTLHWGERTVFDRSVASCDWDTWEQWPSNAKPHRLAFVADPQLVDPHTYPGRPWPLSTFTTLHTDNYIHRAWTRINNVLYPDTVFFLGDLFDGGREWSTTTTKSEEVQWRQYGQKFWLKEYDRFGKLFYPAWTKSGVVPREGQPGRKLIDSLPGNHDLGFASGIQTSVRKRFQAYFGEGSRVDVIANHTFVSLDSVSLSAKGSTSTTDEQIWKPVQEFLDNVQSTKKRAVIRELRRQQGLNTVQLYKHELVDTDDLASNMLPEFQEDPPGFPTILLTHVPLYRSPGEPCGPMRERHPPTPPPKGQTEPVYPDHRNAISVSAGYQYQNVLTEQISKEVTEKVGNISYAFSGDDHDYCEVVHRRYSSAGKGIREITVKSISWAMGVRLPGILMLSMWNPIDKYGNTLESEVGSSNTIQTHQCLLPDQLGIFLQYVTLVVITFACLLLRAALVMVGRLPGSINTPLDSSSILPTSSKAMSSAEFEKTEIHHSRQSSYAEDKSVNGSTSAENRSVLNARNGYARERSGSSAKSTYTYPLINHAGNFGPTKRETRVTAKHTTQKKKKRGLALLWAEFSWSLVKVGGVAFAWYFWLIKTG
ncbi:hypothetical protein EJ05DRAFT_502127 [Pseudovirgaria hyperparasitica]|uniref:Uncharacterized protein n=1 Tax=Pseudovirgaria hyperparasitica TaxID=470096 RepID=A0A6A6W6D2_9PEZI|nr:uncharacterized protein EJ05DRAFT_502127 [Pseudovirgaria hyperparasitica]KAF2756631.1 hypothetical protein EJ05DRAFT_502127 [Pseudovirgaria hyperparasitica]